jgi:hypothetical protein
MPKKVTEKPAAKKTGAGRPVGTGKFGTATKVIRVPVHLVEDIYAFISKKLRAKT